MTPGANGTAWQRHGLAVAFALAALLLRSLQLGTQPLWFDEALTAHIAHAPDGLDFVHNTPPLYHWLCRGWSTWFGIGATGLRSLSAVAGALFVWATFHAARSAFDARTASCAAAFALAAPIHIYYSQEARAYALLVGELMLVLWLLWRLTARDGARGWPWLAITSAAALYTHYLAAIPLAIAYLVVGTAAAAPARWRSARRAAVAGAVACAALVPWLLWWSQRTPFASSDMHWLELLWQRLSGPRAVASSLELFVVGPDAAHAPVFLKQFSSLTFPPLLRLAALVASTLLLALAVWRWRAAPAPQRRAYGQAAALAFGPLAVLWLVSLVRPIYCPGRYDLIALPGFVLFAARSVALATAAPRLWQRLLAWGAAAVVACVVVAKDLAYFQAPAAPDRSRAVAAQLGAQVQAGDAVILTGAVGLPVLAHLYRQGFVWSERRCRSARLEFECRLLPPALETAPAAASRYLAALEDGSLATELQQLVRPLRSDGLWLVLGDELHGEHRAPAMAALGRELFAVLHEAGFELVGGEPELGLARLARR